MKELKRQLRCAIYTRKSSEEGLGQDFNSLHAQREACEAYVTSQAGEGWRLVKTQYDDGGYSGGNMDRPALQQLLAEIAARKIDVIVVYKVDRLTRSLSDFAKIVEIIDRQGVSFVSVTQAFNTTTSMGRLTLNVLLSFAQFEREVTGERIRDKIAASCKKGMWMGGNPPLGYDPKERTLAINPEEAETVRAIFRRYLELRSVQKLTEDLRARNVCTKRWTTRSGRILGGRPFMRGGLYHLLRNPVYIGQIVHRGTTYPGQHEAILEQELWDKSQALLTENAAHHADVVQASDEESFLKGILFDDRGNPMSPNYTSKAKGRHRYYVSQALLQARRADVGSVGRVSALRIEALVQNLLAEIVTQPHRQSLSASSPADRRRFMKEAISKVTLGKHEIAVRLKAAVDKVAIGAARKTHRIAESNGETVFTINTSDLLRGGERLIVAPQNTRTVRSALKTALIRAWRWRSLLESGAARSILDIAKQEKVGERYIKNVMPLAFLPPTELQGILVGTHKKVSEYTIRGTRISWS